VHYKCGLDAQLILLDKFLEKLFRVWCFGSVINILYSGGIPLYWMIAGVGKDYTNYGIPSFGGFIQAINVFLAVSYFILYFYKRERKYLYFFIVQLFWPILVVSRGNFTYMLLEIVGAYLMINRGKIRSIFYLITVFIVFIYLFGVIGDFRFGIERSLAFKQGVLSQEYVSLAEYLPSGLLYVYMYVTTPINNVVYNIVNLNPNYLPYSSSVYLFPTVIRTILFKGGGPTYGLVSETFNTVTFYSGYLVDFGINFTILIVTLIQFVVIILYLNAMRGKLSYIIAYSVAFQCVALSIFSDNFTMNMSIFQILIALYFGKVCRQSVN